MTEQRLEELFNSYIQQQTTAAEEVELMALLTNPSFAPKKEVLIEAAYDTLPVDHVLPDVQAHAIFQNIVQQQKQTPKLHWKRWVAAACIVGVLLTGYWFLNTNKSTVHSPQTTVIHPTNDVKAPDKNRAQITLADGTTVYLDSAGNGQLASANGMKVMKLEDGRIEYKTTDDGRQSTVQYNTLSNPKGSKVIDMTLSDGSRVWLNAGSSITYPVAFIENERSVSMEGEAYFEVAPSNSPQGGGQRQPFIVRRGNMRVTVLGTHFNVNAYVDEDAIRVTLLEGKVKVENGESSTTKAVILKPGQQAVGGTQSPFTIQPSPDLDVVMAWKNGRFYFDGATIETVMRQLARWYNVEVQYEGTVTEHFTGIISRTVNASEVLKMLEQTGVVGFKIEGSKVIVKNRK